MSFLALALMFVVASEPSHSHFIDPFDTYMAGVKARQPNQELMRFGAECGVTVAGVPSHYAVGGSVWTQVPDLAKAVRDLESDHFATAQIWNDLNGRHFVIEWSYDLEQEYRISYCFRADGAVLFEDSRVWMFELPSGKGWSYVRRWTPKTSGHLVATQGQFSGMDGKPIPKPKLDSDEQKNLEYHEDFKKLNDLQLPASMLR